jgi:hypothetical protein
MHMTEDVRTLVASWPKEPKEAAERLVDYYGPPDEIAPSQLTWRNTRDGWKRTVLSRDEVPHGFPAQHNDFLEQSIDYRVPIEKYSALAAYDGSVMAERTKGELSARCGGTSMNFVAINLAHDIVEGRCTVAEARDAYTRLYQAYQAGEKPPYTQGFQFELPATPTADPDTATIVR